MPAPMTTEFELIASIRRDLGTSRVSGVVAGVGDDAAVLRTSRGQDLVVTVDAMVEGRHFKRAWLTWTQLGARLAAINLSDIAAMGAMPRFALVSLAVPKNVSVRAVREIERGASRHLARYGAVVVGGNLSGTRGPLVCDLTLIGTCRRGAAWTRRARAGDAVVVAGELGAAAAGARLLKSRARASGGEPLIRAWKRPVPRLDVGAALRGVRSIHGAIDVSDGFSSDLIHMCIAGGTGCDVTGPAIPVSRAVAAFCRRRGLDPVRWAMDAGEDYALVLSVAPQRAREVCRRIERAGVRASLVGRFTRARGVHRVIDGEGRARRFRPGGWDHMRR
ncbi:MAG: thiamine-phosphate kinase [Candidatus Krumholzibacteria bacterium]|nr:thiamine-phosphate kinase [Candidatus Krumholzibacteria bacterium]MDH4336842.1 thiamine-phosphate kinase [Candidatus Krumholzibacteria bacterium]MDH5269173.1 thiamine-phosphate kinase [Candidatus Krumholzibacteria bacterium]